MYAIVDIETTGGHASTNGITEIAIYIHDGESVCKHFSTLINPGISIPPYISALTGITNSMVASAPSFNDVADQIFEILQDKVFVAHNVNFDFSFVRHHLKLCGYDIQEKKLCTIRLSRNVFPGFRSYSLGNLCRELDIEIQDRHRASGDALATVKLFELILNNGGEALIDKMLKRTSGDQWLPLHLDKSAVDALPTSFGVYYFHDKKDKIIYVGKAVNVRKRVASHFTQNDPDPKRQHLLRNVHKVTFRLCASELHALVLESAEIKRIWPAYNRSQKKPMQKFGLYSFFDCRGYLRLAIDQKKKNLPTHYTFNVLHEGQAMLRKMIEHFRLSRSLCFMSEEGIAESPGLPHHYNKRVQKALDSLGAQLPTFAVVDKLPDENKRLYLLVEKGCFWGMGYVDAQQHIASINDLKEYIEPYTDNDFIRMSIYKYTEANPESKLLMQ